MTQTASQRILSPSFVVLMVGNFSFFTCLWLIIPQLPAYVLELKGRESDIGLVLAAFAFTALAARPFVGQLVDSLGQKRVAVIGGVIFLTAPALYIVATSVPMLVAARMYHGLGLALFTTATTAWVADIVPSARRGEAMGLFTNASQIGLAVAPLLGSVIYLAWGFGALFAASALMGAVVLVAASVARSSGGKGPMMVQGGRFSDALGRGDVLAMTFALMTSAATWGTIMSFLPVLAARRHVGQTAVFFTLYAVVTVVLRLLMGPLSDRLGRRTILIPCLGGMAVVMVAFVGLSSPLFLAVLALLCAVFLGPVYPTMSAFLVDVVHPRLRGSAISVLTAGFDFGIMTGSYGGGLLAERLGVESAFVAAGILALAGVIVFVLGAKEGAP